MVARAVFEPLKPKGRAILEDRHRYKGPPRMQYEWADGPFQAWAKGWVARNFWRVAHTFGSPEDALQECAMVFVRCCNSYQGPANQPKRMMAYFKLAVTNAWNSASVKDRQARDTLPDTDAEEPMEEPLGPLMAALGQCSAEARVFLEGIANAPAEFLQMLLYEVDDTAKLNQRIRRAFGIKKRDADVVGELRNLLS